MMKTDSLKMRDVGTAALEAAAAAKAVAQDMGRAASNRLDEIKHQSAEALHSSAGTMRAAAGRGAAAVTSAAETVAGKLDAASSYIDGCETSNLTGALRRAVARNPGSTVLLAAVLGFCAGTAMSRARKATARSMKEGKL